MTSFSHRASFKALPVITVTTSIGTSVWDLEGDEAGSVAVPSLPLPALPVGSEVSPCNSSTGFAVTQMEASTLGLCHGAVRCVGWAVLPLTSTVDGTRYGDF